VIATIVLHSKGLTCSFCKTFGEKPEFAQGKHVEIIHDGVHEIERKILFALFDVAEMKLLTTHPRRDSGLRLTPAYSQLRDRQSKHFSWRTGSSRIVSTDGFGHIPIVATSFDLKQKL
jgi:hypothetical protein